jgi:hypothetical protein
MKAFRRRARQRSRRWRSCLRQLSVALHGREVASEQPRRGFRYCREDAEHIIFEDGVSRRCENVESWRRRGIENFFPVKQIFPTKIFDERPTYKSSVPNSPSPTRCEFSPFGLTSVPAKINATSIEFSTCCHSIGCGTASPMQFRGHCHPLPARSPSSDAQGRARWRCKCSCGNHCPVS